MHPNTHVNKAQSTNDTIPSATHLAVASELDRIIEGVEVPGDVFAAKAEAFRHVVQLLAGRAPAHARRGVRRLCRSHAASGRQAPCRASGVL